MTLPAPNVKYRLSGLFADIVLLIYPKSLSFLRKFHFLNIPKIDYLFIDFRKAGVRKSIAFRPLNHIFNGSLGVFFWFFVQNFKNIELI